MACTSHVVFLGHVGRFFVICHEQGRWLSTLGTPAGPSLAISAPWAAVFTTDAQRPPLSSCQVASLPHQTSGLLCHCHACFPFA